MEYNHEYEQQVRAMDDSAILEEALLAGRAYRDALRLFNIAKDRMLIVEGIRAERRDNFEIAPVIPLHKPSA